MKTLIFLTGWLFMLHVCSAQEGARNMGKINLSAFAFKGFNIQYERQVADKYTIALGYSKVPNSRINVQQYVERYGGTGNLHFGKFQLATSIFTPEVRWYTGKRGAFRGFYIAPYARIASYNISGPLEFTTGRDNTKRTAVFTGKLNAVSGGLMLGSQFKLSEKIYLDWWIVGASYGTANANVIAVSTLSETEQTDLKSALDEVKIPLTQIHSEVNANGATVTTTGGVAGLRGLGLNIGIRF